MQLTGWRGRSLTPGAQTTYPTTGTGRASLAKHGAAVLRKKVGPTGHSGWQVNGNVLVLSGSGVLGRDGPRTASDSVEGTQREGHAAGDSGLHQVLNRALGHRA